MNQISSNQHIFERLKQTWQPVALSRDLALGQSSSVVLLEESLIIARLPQGLLAARDRCPHRGAQFVLGDIHNGHLRCPYHGWEFDHHGSCKRIPSLADQTHPALQLACLDSYPIQERYGMIWVRLDRDQEAAALPCIPEFESEDWEFHVADPMAFGVGFRREVDNYLDMSHFAFAHGKSLGVAARHMIDGIRITHYRDGLQMDAPFPSLSNPAQTPSKLQQAHQRCQRIYLPNFTTIRQSFHDGDERVLVHIPSPHTETTCTVYWAIAISKNFDGPPLNEQIQFAIGVLDEDRIMVENQRPLEVPLGGEEGVTVPADRLAMAYKRALREFISSDAPLIHEQQQSGQGEARCAIIWGSQTGNSERLASHLQFQLQDHQISADVFDAAHIQAQDLRDYEHVCIITSTYGKGDAPDNMSALYRDLHQLESEDLNGVHFSVCALGDKRYPNFCQCGKDIDAALAAAGGQRFVDRVDCDVDYDQHFKQWSHQVCNALSLHREALLST